MIHRKHFIWFAGLMVTALLILAGCGQGKAEYTVTASGDSVQEGVITVLDYSINVYKDEASNSCGDCEKQPVHLYAGADAEDVAEAIKDVVERADDLWEVVSCDGATVVLREKEAGTVESIGPLSAPDGITLHDFGKRCAGDFGDRSRDRQCAVPGRSSEACGCLRAVV